MLNHTIFKPNGQEKEDSGGAARPKETEGIQLSAVPLARMCEGVN